MILIASVLLLTSMIIPASAGSNNGNGNGNGNAGSNNGNNNGNNNNGSGFGNFFGNGNTGSGHGNNNENGSAVPGFDKDPFKLLIPGFTDGWPMPSTGNGIDPQLQQQLEELMKQHGLPVPPQPSSG
jgi:hypothetical protein